MKPTDFAKHLTAFFSEFLPGAKNLSVNTIFSYRDTFRLLLEYCRECENIATEKLRIASFDDKLLLRFLGWLQQERGSSISTRNIRLAAIRSFFKYVQSQESGLLMTCQLMLTDMTKKLTPHILRLHPSDISILPQIGTHYLSEHILLLKLVLTFKDFIEQIYYQMTKFETSTLALINDNKKEED